jgi:hypothetical protein
MLVNIIVIDRKTSKVKKVASSAQWEINCDYLSSQTSTFTLKEIIPDSQILQGDFLIVKFFGERWVPTTKVRFEDSYNKNEFTAPYYGIVDAYSQHVITCRMLRDVMNTTGIAYTSSKESIVNPIYYMNVMFARYVQRTGMYLDNWTLPQQGNVAYKTWSLPLEEPTSVNLLDLATRLFKDIQMHYDVFSYWRDNDATIHWRIQAGYLLYKITVIADDTKLVANPSVYVRAANYGVPNAIRIQDASSNPGVFDDFYLQTDGTVVQSITSLVTTPLIPTAYYYDSTKMSTPIPSHKDIAVKELATQEYQHEISFDVNLDVASNPSDYLQLGREINIRVSGVTYNSVISSYKLTSTSPWATITCGNIRSNLQTLLGN